MTFKQATDRLFSRIDHRELAKALGVSVASIRQARLKPDALAHRSPPPGWEKALLRLSEERVLHFRKLIEEIRGTAKSEHSR
jgi:DNA-binding GntR family transcriptional regulator